MKQRVSPALALAAIAAVLALVAFLGFKTFAKSSAGPKPVNYAEQTKERAGAMASQMTHAGPSGSPTSAYMESRMRGAGGGK